MKEDEGLIKQLSLLPRYGLVGVFFALIALSAFSGWMLYKVTTNHIAHNTIAIEKNIEVLSELKGVIQAKMR